MNYAKPLICTLFLIIFTTNIFSAEHKNADLYELYSKIKQNIKKKTTKTPSNDILKAITEFYKESDPVNLQETINQIELLCSMAGLEESLISMILQNRFDIKNYPEKQLISALLTEIGIIEEYIETLTKFVSNILDGKTKKNIKTEEQKALIIAKIDELNIKINHKEDILKNYQKMILHCKLELELKAKNYQTRCQQPEQKPDVLIQEQIEENKTLLIVLKRQCQIIQDELDELLDQTRSLETELFAES